MMLRCLLASCLTLLLCAAMNTNLRASAGQVAGGEITGEVHDPEGAVVPGAKVYAKDTQTNLTVVTTTSASGSYTVANLRPGTYQVSIEASGFKRLVREGVVVSTGEKIRLDLEVVLGSVTEAVTVVGETPLLRADTGSLGQVISNRSIVELPLNGRNFLSLVGLAAGVANPPGSTTPRLGGGRPRTNEYLYDGIAVLQPEPGQVPWYPIIDAIQEFKLEINSPSAEFGFFNGGVVNLTTKAGTNQYHGTAFEFFRNEALNARNLFAPKTAANPNKPTFRRNQFGGVIGGPIYKDKSFFFLDYQGTKQLIARVRTSTVPTMLQRQGIFTEAISGVVPRIYDPATSRTNPVGTGVTRDQFQNNTIPQNRLDPVAMALLNRFPLPTSSGTANNYTRIANEPDDQHQFDARVDHRFSSRNVVFGRYSYSIDDTSPATPLPDGSGAITTGVIGAATTLGQGFASSYVHVFSDRMSNELRAGYTRRSFDQSATTLPTPPSDSLKLPGIPTNAFFNSTLPTFTINGFQQIGSPANSAVVSRTDVTEFVDALSFQRGNHSLKVGLDYRFKRLDITSPPQPTGLFNFSTLFTDLPGVTGTGNALASFLLGQVNTFSIDLQQKKFQNRARNEEYFVQDDWKALRWMTVNAGVRWTLNHPSREAENQGAVFNLQTQKLEYFGKNGFPETARKLHWKNFGPRLGLAFRLTDKTVLRTGFGLTWIEQAGITTPFTTPQFPFIQTVPLRTLNNLDPAFLLKNGPTIPPPNLGPDAGLGQGVFTVDRDLGSGYVMQWNMGIQQELPGNFAFEIAYAGNKTVHTGIPDTNINQLTVDQLRLGTFLTATTQNPYFGIIPRQLSLGNPTISNGQLLKPFPAFTNVTFYRNNVGNTHYDALQVKLERRISRGLAFLVSYTRSKLMDDASQVFSNTIFTGPVVNYPVADSFNRHLERDVSTGDIPNVFTASWTYDLPIGAGKRWSPGGVVGKLTGGWSLMGIVTLQSGLPLALTQATNFNAFAGFGVQRPNRIANPELDNPTTAQWFNVAAFQTAPQFTIGNSSRNPVRGPAYRNTDFSLIKKTYLTERTNLEFRAEAFNLTNTPPLGAPAVVLGNAGFGSITSAGDPRVIQLALKLNF